MMAMAKHQTPKINLQRNTKLEVWSLEFEVFVVFGVWCLVFGV